MAQDSPSGSFAPLVNPAPGPPFTSAELRKISSIHLHPEIAFLQVLTVRLAAADGRSGTARQGERRTQKYFSTYYSAERRMRYLCPLFLLAVPTGWIYDLWAGKGMPVFDQRRSADPTAEECTTRLRPL